MQVKTLVVGDAAQLQVAIAAAANQYPWACDICELGPEADQGHSDLIQRIRSQTEPYQYIICVFGQRMYDACERSAEDNSYSPEFVQQLAKVCDETGGAMIWLSNGAVFETSEGGVFTERCEPEQPSAHLLPLYQAEGVVREHCARHLIMRVGPLVDLQGDNLLTRLLGDKRWAPLQWAEQQTIAPTPVVELVRVLDAIIKQLQCGADVWDTYHYCCTGVTSLNDFASALNHMALERNIHSQNLAHPDYVDETAVKVGLLDCQRMRRVFGIKQRHWRPAVAELMAHFGANVQGVTK